LVTSTLDAMCADSFQSRLLEDSVKELEAGSWGDRPSISS
jgi:hypothetical protein